MKEYYKQLHGHRFDNMEEMDQFLENHTLSKVSQGELGNLNTSLITQETICLMLPPQENLQALIDSLDNSTKCLKNDHQFYMIPSRK